MYIHDFQRVPSVRSIVVLLYRVKSGTKSVLSHGIATCKVRSLTTAVRGLAWPWLVKVTWARAKLR